MDQGVRGFGNLRPVGGYKWISAVPLETNNISSQQRQMQYNYICHFHMLTFRETGAAGKGGGRRSDGRRLQLKRSILAAILELF